MPLADVDEIEDLNFGNFAVFIAKQLRSAHAQWSSVKVQQHNKDFNRFNAVLFVFKIGLKHVFFNQV
jgi:hypothetical protein